MAKRRSPRRRSPRQTAAHDVGERVGVRYIESSALVAALLENDAAARNTSPGTRLVTSALTIAEAGRAVIRARVSGRLTADQERAAVRALRTFEHRCFIFDVDRAVLDRVGRLFPVEPVRTLDAIHLATVDVLDEPPPLVTVVTRDDRVRENARALGYAVE